MLYAHLLLSGLLCEVGGLVALYIFGKKTVAGKRAAWGKRLGPAFFFFGAMEIVFYSLMQSHFLLTAATIFAGICVWRIIRG
ncbi:hypothetical protein FACS1894206_06590 [Deltaproteobacteria bacterium]|nr:hypothetical protein FACS1894206_06590 [Deltaproteobacteria bacterium]